MQPQWTVGGPQSTSSFQVIPGNLLIKSVTQMKYQQENHSADLCLPTVTNLAL